MKKRAVVALLVFAVLFNFLTGVFVKEVQAYQNNSYYNKIKIGLKSMVASSIKLIFNGEYLLNGQTIPSNTAMNLIISNGKILYNNVEYDSLTFTPKQRTNTISVTSGSKTYKYFGTILAKNLSGQIFVINTLNIEDYLKGVVGLEMSDYFPLEALKAQAIAARNYTLANLGSYAALGYDLDDTPACQAYGGYNESDKNVILAVEQTKGQVSLYNEALVQSFYSASNGGYTEASENVWASALPYLRQKIDTYENELWPSGNKIFTNGQIENILKTKGYIASTDTFLKLDLSSVILYPSKRVASIDIVYKDSLGTERRKSITKDRARTFLTLPSSMYTITYESLKGEYTFSGKGNGHGVGMSQMGAKYRALAGQRYDDILKFYYDGSYVQSVLAKIGSATIDRQYTLIGQPINVTVQGSGGSSQGYLYKYVVSQGGNAIFTKEYSTESTFTYNPTAAGNYQITVYLKDKLSEEISEDQRSISFTTYDTPNLSAALDKVNVLAGQAVTATAQGNRGSQAYLYKYLVVKDGTVVATKEYSADTSMTYVPTAGGNYELKIYLKDQVSASASDALTIQKFVVYELPRINSTDITGTMYEKRPVSISVQAAAENMAVLNYQFELYKDNSLLNQKAFSSEFSYSFTPSVSGQYIVKVYVRNATNGMQYDMIQEIPITILKEPIIVSTLPIYWGMRGADVIAIQQGLTNLGYSVGTIDGIFGSKTYNAIVSFQNAKGVKATGAVDQITLKAMNDALIEKITTQ